MILMEYLLECLRLLLVVLFNSNHFTTYILGMQYNENYMFIHRVHYWIFTTTVVCIVPPAYRMNAHHVPCTTAAHALNACTVSLLVTSTMLRNNIQSDGAQDRSWWTTQVFMRQMETLTVVETLTVQMSGLVHYPVSVLSLSLSLSREVHAHVYCPM